MLKDGTDSELWQLMVEHGVDAYFAGEHHRITVMKRDGIWQIVHGALWGTQTDVNYLRGQVLPGQLTLELMQFDVEYSGGYIGDHPHRGETNRPREKVTISDRALTAGPQSVGKLIIEIDAEGQKRDVVRTGYFE
jgi:hypothetical protein